MKAKMALLTNFIPPYRVPLLNALKAHLESLKIFISTPMESNRPWLVNWGTLDVTVQKNVSLTRKWRHPHGFIEKISVHIPYDTLWLLWKSRPDVVISGEMGLRTLQAFAYRLINPESRLIIWATVSEHSEQGRGRIRSWMRRFLLPRADAVIVNGESGKRYVMAYGVAPEKIFASPYTTESGAFLANKPADSNRQRYHLLSVGQLIERKGILPFLRVLIRYAEENPGKEILLKFVGDGLVRQDIERLSRPENIVMEFVGNLQYQDIPEQYSDADIFIFPTLADEWGLVVNEAMAAGLPVLGSVYSQAVEELVVAGETGWSFAPDDDEAIRDALHAALTCSKDQLRKMGEAARDKVNALTPEMAARRIAEACSYVQNHPAGS